jgi:hypothetical protein
MEILMIADMTDSMNVCMIVSMTAWLRSYNIDRFRQLSVRRLASMTARQCDCNPSRLLVISHGENGGNWPQIDSCKPLAKHTSGFQYSCLGYYRFHWKIILSVIALTS